MRNIFVTISACAVVVLSACSDQGTTRPDTRATPRFTTDPSSVPCTDPELIDDLIVAYFGAGSPDANSALGKWDNIKRQQAADNTADVTAKTWNLVDFLVTKQQQNKLPANETSELLGRALFCFAGIDGTLPATRNAWVVYPTDSVRTLVTEDGYAGVQLTGANVDETSLISIVESPDTLRTNLDTYPVVYEFSKYPSNVFTDQVTAAVCGAIDVNTPDEVLDHLVLGHNRGAADFELLPKVNVDFLACAPLASASAPTSLGGALLALLLPANLYAAGPGASGIGGTLLEFSPVGPVDPRITVTPNAAGTSAPIGSTVLPPPAVTLLTPNGTPLGGIPVAFTVASGSGSIAPASAATGADGTASSTLWRVGVVAGSNSVTATPGTGGDAVPGAVFVPAVHTFTATATPPTGIEITGGPVAGTTYVAGTILPTATIRVVGEGNRTAEGYTGPIGAGALQGGPLVGTASVNAVAGVASFSDLAIQKAGATQQLRFTAGALFADTGTFAIGAAAAASLAIDGGNGQTALIGTVLGVAAGTTAPSVLVRDAYGNPVAGQTVYFTASNNSAVVTPLVHPTNAAGNASATWQLQSGLNEMLASLDVTPTLDETRFTLFTATGTTSSTPIVACAPGNQKDPINQFVTRVDGSNKHVTDAKFYFSITGSANALTPYRLRVRATVYDRFGVLQRTQDSDVSQVYLRGSNSEQKEANFYFPVAIVSGSNTKVVYTILPAQPITGTISFNTGSCAPGNTKCTVPIACKVVNEAAIATPLGAVYRMSPAIRLFGY